MSDTNMHLFIEKGMRGGVSYISKRHSKIEAKKSIIYWDANNLYGSAMNQYLPCSGFKWLSRKEINSFCLDSISENSSIG